LGTASTALPIMKNLLRSRLVLLLSAVLFLVTTASASSA
jgi:hypothetical protein